MTQLNLKTVAENVVETMRNSPEKWGSSDWNLAINLNDGSVSIDHNTLRYNLCCANREVALTSMYDFNTDGWFNESDNDEYEILRTTEEWLGSGMFSKHAISEMTAEIAY